MLHGPEHVAEQEARPLQGAEQVADQRKRAALDAAIQDGRALGLIDAPLNLGGFEIRIDFLVDAHELPGALEVGHTFTQAAIAHDFPVASGLRPVLDLFGRIAWGLPTSQILSKCLVDGRLVGECSGRVLG